VGEAHDQTLKLGRKPAPNTLAANSAADRTTPFLSWLHVCVCFLKLTSRPAPRLALRAPQCHHRLCVVELVLGHAQALLVSCSITFD